MLSDVFDIIHRAGPRGAHVGLIEAKLKQQFGPVATATTEDMLNRLEAKGLLQLVGENFIAVNRPEVYE